MIKRFVKMTFKPEHIQDFITLFDSKKNLIAGFEGCMGVELLNDINNPCVFFTYSIWKHPDYLEAYRTSELFNSVWSQTKQLFDAKPEAWSLTQKI